MKNESPHDVWIEWGRVGWTNVDQIYAGDTGERLLVRVTLPRRNRWQVVCQIAAGISTPTRGDQVAIIFPGGDLSPGNGIIIALPRSA